MHFEIGLWKGLKLHSNETICCVFAQKQFWCALDTLAIMQFLFEISNALSTRVAIDLFLYCSFCQLVIRFNSLAVFSEQQKGQDTRRC
jgi:hypothetical protein